LVVAYETTLEGWAKTLELRDRETEGHSQRVLDLTTRLARKLGVPDEEMIHLQRGALLHDIGKMGIPDSILMKEGSLSDEEWGVMKKHPIMAKDMLSSIPFLQNATDIPYCHHEKWDGSGYPNGLKENEIPLSARIFALVDVWDALRSDRPYRKAWSDDDSLDYIHEQSGRHFDPAVVKAFDEIIMLEQRGYRKK
jgi:putative nucleotidyltransferase with HDIG domain